MKREYLLVPADVALVFDANGWRLSVRGPEWLLAELEPEIADAPKPRCAGANCQTCRARRRAYERRRAAAAT